MNNSEVSVLENALASLNECVTNLELELQAKQNAVHETSIEKDGLQEEKHKEQLAAKDARRELQLIKNVQNILGKSLATLSSNEVIKKEMFSNEFENIVNGGGDDDAEQQSGAGTPTKSKTSAAREELYALRCEMERSKAEHEEVMEALRQEQSEVRALLARVMHNATPMSDRSPTPNHFGGGSAVSTPIHNTMLSQPHPSHSREDSVMTVSTTATSPVSACTTSTNAQQQRHHRRMRLPGTLFRIESIMGVRSESHDVERQVQSLRNDNAALKERSDFLSHMIQYILQKVHADKAPKKRGFELTKTVSRAWDAHKTKETRLQALWQQHVLIEDALAHRAELIEEMQLLRENLGL